MGTSFNSKGKPIVNTVSDSLKMLDELADLDYVLIEDWLFRAPPKSAESDVTPARRPLEPWKNPGLKEHVLAHRVVDKLLRDRRKIRNIIGPVSDRWKIACDASGCLANASH